MIEDPVVEEVRRVRKELSAKAGHDVDQFFAQLRETEKRMRAEGYIFADRLKKAKPTE